MRLWVILKGMENRFCYQNKTSLRGKKSNIFMDNPEPSPKLFYYEIAWKRCTD